MANFIPSRPLPDFYAGNMAPPMRMPDGSLAPAPNTLSPADAAAYQAWYQSSLPTLPKPPSVPPIRSIEINPDGTPKTGSLQAGGNSGSAYGYGAARPSNVTAEGLAVRPVNSVPIDPTTGMPANVSTSGLQTALNGLAAQRALSLNGSTRTTTGQAGSVAMTPGVVPKSVQTAFAHMPSPSSLAGKSLLSAGLSLTGRTGNNSIAAMNANDVVQSRPYQAQSPQSTVNAATPLDAYRLGLTNPPRVPPPVQAIAQATKQVQVPNPAYAAYRASIGNDVKETHGKVNVQPPPQYITKTVPIVPAPPGGINPQSKAGRLISLVSSLLPSQPIAGVNTPGLPQGAYDPRVDVTGRSQQHNAGGWGINAGGGIDPF